MKYPIIIAFVWILVSCGPAQEPVSPTAILFSNANVVDVANGRVLEAQQVVVDSGKIVKIAPSVEQREQYPLTINASGKYLVPGLAEMHAHIPSPPTTDERTIETLFLYLSQGVTTIRGMLGHPAHLQLREQAAANEILSPRIFTSSPSLNGNTVPTPEVADSLVRTYARDGYDFLKIHPGIPLPAFNALAATAQEVGIPYAGHVPVDVGIRHALESGYATVDHVDGFLEGLVPESAGADPNANGFFGYNFTPLADTTKIDELVAMDREHGVWIVTTQSLFERWFAPVTAETLAEQPEMKYMPASTLKAWTASKLDASGPDSSFEEAQWEQFIHIRRLLIKALQEEGQGILLGSDAPQIFNVPGFSIHHEIQGMLRAGLTPLEILRAGTMNPAEYLGMPNAFGQVKEGFSADLLLVDGNPLEDPATLKDPAGVMVRGKWLDRETIEQKLFEIANHAKDQ